MVHLNGRTYSEEDVKLVDAVGEGVEFKKSSESGEEVIGMICTLIEVIRGVVVCLVVWLHIPS